MTPLETILWVINREIDGTKEALTMVARMSAQGEGQTSLGPGTGDRLRKRLEELQAALVWAETQSRAPN